MQLKELLEDLAEKMQANKWENKEVGFCTINRTGLGYLSISHAETNDKITIDIGTQEDAGYSNTSQTQKDPVEHGEAELGHTSWTQEDV